MSTSEIDYLFEQKEFKRLFPNAKFTIAIPLSELYTIFSYENILVFIEYKCIAFYESPNETDYFVIKQTNNKPITNHQVIQYLIDMNFAPICDHRFYEGLDMVHTNHKYL